MGVVVLAVASLATAQQVPQPMVRIGNFMEVGNDVFMKIMATADIRYKTTENWDFASDVRDQPNSRFPTSSTSHEGEGDLTFAELRLGVEARYQKNLTLYLLFEHQQVFDGNLIDDRSNSTTPGGTSVFGTAPRTENPGFHTERYWIDYKFQGTPLRMRVGADLWNVDQAGIVGDDDPRFAVFLDLGNFDVTAAAVIQYESQRLGLTNDNDLVYYTFSAGYNLKPHRFQLDLVYMRDRFAGADLANPRVDADSPIGFQGQKTDSYLIMGSWSGALGPVRALLQGNVNVGKARGGTNVTNIPPGVKAGRDYDIFSGSAIAYAEVDLGIVKPFAGFIYGSGDGDPTDKQLKGFSPASWQDVTQITGTTWFSQLDTSTNFAGRDYACPARSQRVRTAATPATGPLAIGTEVLNGGGTTECNHSNSNPYNNNLGYTSHLGLGTAYSNPGTLLIPVGLKAYPLKGHELVGFFVYRAMTNTGLLERAFVVGVDPGFKGSFNKEQIYEFGGFWQWTLNPYFDIRVAGNAAFLGEGYRDLAKLSDCNLTAPGFQSCSGKATALKGDLRFRARF
jgi:hypothetical protein